MTECDPQVLVNDARCYQCVIDQGMFLPALLYLLCKTTQGVQVNCDPRSLANDSRCFAECIPNGYMGAAILNVLCQLNQQGIGGTCLVCEDHDPEDGVDIPPCDCSLWVATKGEVQNLWSSNDGATWKIIGTYWP